MPTTTLAVHHRELDRDIEDPPILHHTVDAKNPDSSSSSPTGLCIISEHDYLRSVIPSQRDACAKQPGSDCHNASPTRLQHLENSQSKPARALMAALTYPSDPNMALGGGAPGSPPDLTNSKSSKSSSFHSSTLSDYMGPSDLSHFEDINLDDIQASRNSISSISSSRSTPHAHPHAAPHHSFRDLTGASKPRYPSLKGQVHNATRQQSSSSSSQLQAPGKLRRGFTSPSAPSLTNMSGLTAPSGRRSRSPSPSHSHTFPAAPRTLSRKSSRNLDVLPSPTVNSRRQSWQTGGSRKTVKQLEAECDDDGDDDLPEDAIIWNVPISPRPAQERSPAPSSCGSPPQGSPHLGSRPNSRPTSRPNSRPPSIREEEEVPSARSSPALSAKSFPSSPHLANKENFPPSNRLERRRTNTWEDTYATLDTDAKSMTEKLEEFQTELELQQETKRQQSRSSSMEQTERKQKAASLPPLRKSDPLVDPLQPSMEKEKYLSRTRPSWLPPKDPKEEKKHLKEYQRMLARIQEHERLEAQRQEEEAIAKEKAERVKAEYWSNLLLPNWETEMKIPELKATHRKMWWNGIPAKFRGTVWRKAIGNDLEVTEGTFKVALEAGKNQVKELGDAALGGKYIKTVENTKTVFPELKMFAPQTEDTPEQPLFQDLVDVCIAYTSYRPDVDTTAGIHHIAALCLLNMSPAETFITIANLFNRPLPISFLVRDNTAMNAAYDITLSALSKKHPRLAQRLAHIRIEPRDFLMPLFSSLFCDRLGIEHAARIMDVYTIEGDKIPPRVAVGLFGILEAGCMSGEVEDVLDVLRNKTILQGPDDFMGVVYEAGKSS